jgi:hypothetical protein
MAKAVMLAAIPDNPNTAEPAIIVPIAHASVHSKKNIKKLIIKAIIASNFLQFF